MRSDAMYDAMYSATAMARGGRLDHRRCPHPPRGTGDVALTVVDGD
ncbi:hypothetical protein [Pseudonocardia acidicola]|uniref:Uncharacterized protein n=1 Tax=Pseudonocardia acidicola TaxID=2724939 RepID=A0ABX1SA03_9PSEU|nr:hypothetical protein [Pseudonocardia acidicola]NMH97712.1 hypothetical protein [Pseudonocardia acidicola]